MHKDFKMTLNEWLGENNDIGQDIWRGKYQHNDETLEEWFDRVSGGDEKIREEIRAKRFLFGGRILANRGLNKEGIKVTYSNCYVLPPPEDNIESIYDTAKELARTFSYGGGVGIDISNLAPKGAKVHNTAKQTSGAVSFMDLYSATTGLIGQNGRRGALMISIDCNHPDLEEFIDIKSDLDKVTTANISIKMDDDFMDAVVKEQKINLRFTRPETGEVIEKKVDARKVFKRLAFNNWDMGEPGILFWDKINSWNLLSEDKTFSYAGTNPCLVGSTLIQTTNGLVPIKDLVGLNPDVYCMDDDGNLAIAKASKVWKTRTDAQTVTVVTGKGNITCTPDHLIFTTNRGWVKAQHLKKGDKIKGLNRAMKDETHVGVALSGGKYIAEHRFVMSHYEDIDGLDVHHIDGDTFNNKITNLQPLTHGEHSTITNTGREIEVNRDEETGRYLPKAIKAMRKSINQGKQVGTNWYVKEVRWNTRKEDVYDITVPTYHNFIANDMVVHNCAEEPLPAYGSCLLGSINLSEFVDRPFEKTSEFNFSKFQRTVFRAVGALNDVLDEGLPLHPLSGQQNTVRDWRQIGLGVFGIADMLVKMGIKYGSEESIELFDKIGKALARSAIVESNNLARKYGAYPNYNDKVMKSKYIRNLFTESEIKELDLHGLRNSQLLTIAPTGTLSTMLQVSGGIEPYFATSWQRTTKSLHGEDVVYTERPKTINELMVVELGIEDDEDLPDYVVTSANIAPFDRIKVQSTWQRYIDASISSTINLPHSATVEDVENIYIEAWKQGLKGVTIFRDGCRRVGILTTSTNDTDEETTKPASFGRGDVIDISDDLVGKKRKLITGCGSLHCLAYFDPVTGDLMEIYLNRGSTGGCANFMTGLSRMVSHAARLGGDIDGIIDQLNSCGVCPSYATRRATKHDTSKGACCPIAVGYALKEMWLEMQDELGLIEPIIEDDEVEEEISNPICPECGAELIFEGGCNSCKSCGYSKCD